MRRKLVKIGKKFIAFTLAAAMVAQPATGIPFVSSMVVSAEETKEPTPEIPTEIQALEEEGLVKNGDFSADITVGEDEEDSDWVFWTGDDGKGTAARDNNGGLDVKITAVGSNPWSVQLYQQLAVEEGKRYQLIFDVESETGGSFVLGIQEQNDPWTHILPDSIEETITLGESDSKTITRVTLPTPASFITNECRLVFMFGNNADNVGKTFKISNVSMKEYVPEVEKPEVEPGKSSDEKVPEIGSTIKKTDKDNKENTWKLQWSDEFSDGTLDLTKWDYQDGDGTKYGGADLAGWGNDEEEIYTDGNEYGNKNLKVTDGKLVITAKKEADGTYSSARIWTKGDDYNEGKANEPLFAKKYGRIEAKMELPSGDNGSMTGAWPAFWMMPVDDVYGSWARSGELDIMEARGRVKNSVDGTIHYGKTWPDNKNTGGSYTKDDFDIRDEHLYAVEWLPGKISWYVDDVCYYSTSNWFSSSTDNAENFTYPAPYDQEFYILLNLAVGGNYDGKQLNESWEKAQMSVDYVRVYDLVDVDGKVHDYAADEKKVEAASLGSSGGLLGGNLNENLFDGNLTEAKQITEHKTDIKGWYLQCGNGGQASVSAAEDGAKVEISSAGTETYSVQLMNQVPLTAGYSYELSFEAKADANRSITAQMGDFVDGFVGSWNKYSDGFAADLSTTWKTFTYQFDMVDPTDETTRLELNLGQSSKETVYIRNVTLKATGKTEIMESDSEKAPLASGEHIYNGTFDQGNEKNDAGEYTRLRFWSTTGGATAKVNDKRQAVITGTDASAALVQKNVQLMARDTYKITLNANGTSGEKITVKVTGSDGTKYTEQEVALGEGTKEVEFKVPDAATAEYGDVAIVVGSTNGDVTIDNVSMKRLTNYSQDFSDIKVYPLNNGDFSQGLTGWDPFLDGGKLEPVVENGVCTISTEPHKDAWHKMLTQNIDIVKGQTYELSFDYKSDKPDQLISAKIETNDGSYSPVMDEAKVTAGTDWQTEKVSFTAKQGGRVALKFLLSSVNQNCNISLKNIDLCIANTGVKKSPVLVADSTMVKIGENLVYNVEVKAEDESTWNTAEKNVTVNDVPVETTYNAETRKLTILADAFKRNGAYTIVIKANGFDLVQLYDQKIYDATGNLILNGDFASESKAPWGDYVHNSSATTNYDNGYFAANYIHGEGTDYGKMAAWSIQLFQTIDVFEAGDYTLNFVASSQVERRIKIEFGTDSKIIKIEKDPKLYLVDFSGLEAKDYKVNFCLGPVNEDGTEMDIEGFKDFDSHWIFMDDISFLPKGTAVDPTIPDTFEIPDETKVNAVKPVIGTQPKDGEYEINEEVTLSVAASVTDAGTLKYQWYKNTENSSANGEPITGATAAAYKPDTSTEGMTYYYCIVTNENNNVSGQRSAETTSAVVKVDVVKEKGNVDEYTVTFSSNGGSEVASQTVKSGATVTKPADPTKEGYTFVGWYNGSAAYNFNTPVTSDLTLTAQWDKNDDQKAVPTGITLDKKEETVKVGSTVKLTATVTPAEAQDKTVTWNSSDEAIATVKDGMVTAIKVGTATITATTTNGLSAKCVVTVEPATTPGDDQTGGSQTDGNQDEPKAEAKGKTITDTKSGASYTVTVSDAKNGEVAYNGPTNKKTKTVKVPTTIAKDGITYKVTSIAANALKNNKNVTKVTISSTINKIGANAFSGCTKLKTVTIGANVTVIEAKAFYKCTKLTKITIPAKVTTIGKQAFASCKNLKTITIKTTKLTDKKVGKNAFKGIKSNATIKVPKNKLNAYKKLLKKKGVGSKTKIKK